MKTGGAGAKRRKRRPIQPLLSSLSILPQVPCCLPYCVAFCSAVPTHIKACRWEKNWWSRSKEKNATTVTSSPLLAPLSLLRSSLRLAPRWATPGLCCTFPRPDARGPGAAWQRMSASSRAEGTLPWAENPPLPPSQMGLVRGDHGGTFWATGAILRQGRGDGGLYSL